MTLLFKMQKTYENFPGHRFETQIHIQTQIRLNTILTLATKHFMIINKDNLSTPQALLEALSLELLCDVIFPSLHGQSDILCFTMAIFHLDDYHWRPNFSNHTKLKQKTFN